MIKVFFDASVIIAAIMSSKGASFELLKYASRKKIIAITSKTVINEVLANLHKIEDFNEKDLDSFIVNNKIIVRKAVGRSEIKQFADVVYQKDAHVLAGARLTDSDYLVSLDRKHIVKNEIRNKVKDIQVVLPKELLYKLRKILKQYN